MTQISLQEAQARLPELINELEPGVQVTLTVDNLPVATILRVGQTKQWPCQAGSARGKIILAPDFDAPMEEFEEYVN